MTVQIVIVTHNQIGQELLAAVTGMFDTSKLNIKTISIPSDITAAQITEFSDMVNATMQNTLNNDTLILCDVYGATPYNLVKKFSPQSNVSLLTGLNLAMLLKAVQLTESSLTEIAQQALLCAQESLILE